MVSKEPKHATRVAPVNEVLVARATNKDNQSSYQPNLELTVARVCNQKHQSLITRYHLRKTV